MSEETWQAVEDALRVHMAAENDGAYLTGWVAIAVAVSAKSTDMAHYQYMNHQGPAHEWMGLLQMGQARATEYSLRQALLHYRNGDDDEEDGP